MRGSLKSDVEAAFGNVHLPARRVIGSHEVEPTGNNAPAGVKMRDGQLPIVLVQLHVIHRRVVFRMGTAFAGSKRIGVAFLHQQAIGRDAHGLNGGHGPIGGGDAEEEAAAFTSTQVIVPDVQAGIGVGRAGHEHAPINLAAEGHRAGRGFRRQLRGRVFFLALRQAQQQPKQGQETAGGQAVKYGSKIRPTEKDTFKASF